MDEFKTFIENISLQYGGDQDFNPLFRIYLILTYEEKRAVQLMLEDAALDPSKLAPHSFKEIPGPYTFEYCAFTIPFVAQVNIIPNHSSENCLPILKWVNNSEEYYATYKSFL